MAEILWHRRETRRQTDNTNIGLRYRATSRLYVVLAAVFGDCPERAMGVELLSPFGSWPRANQLSLLLCGQRENRHRRQAGSLFWP